MSTAAELAAASGLPDHEAWRLLEAVVGDRRPDLMGTVLTAEVAARFEALAARRRRKEPLQYLEGTVQFGSLTLLCDDRALIPRPETEGLWEQAVESLGLAGPGTIIVDLCTGSGNLALALKHSFPQAQVYGVDVSPAALSLAKENAALTGLDVTFLQGDLFEALPPALKGRVDLVVANPPYVAEDEFDELPAEVRDHEPRTALVAGPAGTEALAAIAEESYWWLGVGGWVLCEIGENQGDEAQRLFAGFDREVRCDLAGRPRYLVARKGVSCCR